MLVLLLASSARGLTLYDLGCKPGDPTFDNGAMIEKALAEGRITEPIICPGGDWWFPKPCNLSNKTAITFIGQGFSRWLPDEAHYRSKLQGGDGACRFLGREIFKMHGVGGRFQGINFHNGYWSIKRPAWDGSCAIHALMAENGPPVGKWQFDQCSFAGYEYALWLTGTDHCDAFGGSWVWVEDCASFIRGDNPQTNEIDFQQVHIAGRSRIVFDMQAGAGIHVGTLGVMEDTLIFRTHAEINHCSFRVDLLKLDAHAAGWRLVEAEGPIHLKVWGMMARLAKPGPDPIQLTGEKPSWLGDDWQHVDVELWHMGRLWPGTAGNLGGE